jgi:hypothetical protein
MPKYGHVSHISGKRGRTFAALQTAWQSEVDSNPHGRVPRKEPRPNGTLEGVVVKS